MQTSVWRLHGGQFELDARINLTLNCLSLKGVSQRPSRSFLKMSTRDRIRVNDASVSLDSELPW